MKIKAPIAALAFFVAGSSAALAAPVSLSKTNPHSVFDNGGRTYLNITNTGNPATDQNVTAGGFRLSTGAANIIAWCVDIAHNLSLKGLYQVTNVPFSNTFAFSQVQKDNIKSLFETNYSNLDLNSNGQSAGFQLALWEILYENSGKLDVTDGSFKSTSDTAAREHANTFLGNLGGAITQSYKLDYYESLGYGRDQSRYSQNLVSATPVPIPAAGFLLACGLSGIYLAQRRRKS